jgi:putative membrane protein
MYFWVKALHIIAVISWMAGMLYLPRLYVYHADAKLGGEASEMLKIMERRLLRFIINPAMIATWGFGLWLATLYGWANLKHEGWFHVKLLMVILLQVCHALFARWRRDFANDRNVHSAKFYRIFNEVPTLLMIIIVLMAVIKPF